MLKPEMNELMDELEKKEDVAAQILAMKREIIETDFKRNKNREALRALSKEGSSSRGMKTWICSGNIFIKTPTDHATKMISDDQKCLDQNIDSLRNELKSKVDKLQEMETGKKISSSNHPSGNLKPLTPEEKAALHLLLGE